MKTMQHFLVASLAVALLLGAGCNKSEPGAVKGVVIDSNLFKPGSTWEISAKPLPGGGSQVEIVAVRHLRGRGLLLIPFFPLGLARQSVAEHLRHFLASLENETAVS